MCDVCDANELLEKDPEGNFYLVKRGRKGVPQAATVLFRLLEGREAEGPAQVIIQRQMGEIRENPRLYRTSCLADVMLALGTSIKWHFCTDAAKAWWTNLDAPEPGTLANARIPENELTEPMKMALSTFAALG